MLEYILWLDIYKSKDLRIILGSADLHDHIVKKSNFSSPNLVKPSQMHNDLTQMMYSDFSHQMTQTSALIFDTRVSHSGSGSDAAMVSDFKFRFLNIYLNLFILKRSLAKHMKEISAPK